LAPLRRARPSASATTAPCSPPPAGRQLITVDPVIYPRHFNDAVPPRDVGAKLLKRNLSDLAAMGGRPTAAVLALTLDARTSLAWLESFYRGLAACARRYRVPIVGGDIAQADGTVAASLTLLGEAAGARVVTRTGARRGDWIYVTGELGASLPTRHHVTFTPRLAEGAWLARHAAVHAMLDLSDGLAKDLRALTPAHSAPALTAAALPLRRTADVRAALADGEDYELVFASPPAPTAKNSPRLAPRLPPHAPHVRRPLRRRRPSPPTPSTSPTTVATNIYAKLRAGVVTSSAAETQTLAAEFAAALPPDATLALHGDLGVGKTTFVQGLARAFGITDHVTSPTFTIFTLHRGQGPLACAILCHLDAYRLERGAQLDALMLEDFLTPPYCLAVEWPDNVADWLRAPSTLHLDLGIAPDERHTLRLKSPSIGAR
jgi:thiamine-monophosphate kinase